MLIHILCLACLAAANGANDVSRAAATLVGGKVTAYKRAMLWTVGWTLLGSALSGWLAAGVARRFGAAVAGNAHELDVAIPAVLLGSCAWVAVATYRKLPVATTHSLVGSLLGVTWAAGGWAACHRIDLARGFMVPLIASPFIAMTFSIALRKLLPAVAIRTPKALDRGHWVSAGLTALSRGINDSAKIWAILLPLAVVFHGQVAQFTHLTQATVALAMLSGSLVAGHRVTERLAFGVAPMSCVDSVVANAVTATTIIAASLLSFPVASSHVVSGAILGTGLASNRNGLKWRSILEMASAWVLTLPAAAILSTTMFFGLRRAKAAGVAPATAILGVLLVAAIIAAAIQLMRESGRTRTTVGATSASLPARLVVFVCNSNTSRSPMAAELCKALLARTELRIAADGGGAISVLSRGITASDGETMAPHAVSALRRLKVTPDAHAAANLSQEIMERASVILCMTEKQVSEVRNEFPSYGSKIFQLDDAADIPNPAGKDQSEFDRVAELLSNAIGARMGIILAA